METAVEGEKNTSLGMSLSNALSPKPAGKKPLMKVIGFVALAVSLIAYTILFYVLYANAGKDVRILTVIPCIVAASFLGMRWGFVMVAFCNLVTTPLYLYHLSGEALPSIYLGNIVGILMTAMVALIIGMLHDMYGKIKTLNEEVNLLSRKDHLTGILNRRALYELADMELKKTLRQKSDVGFYLGKDEARDKDGEANLFSHFLGDKEREVVAPEPRDINDEAHKATADIGDYVGVLSCAIIDVDFFKKINDTYGHLAGDKVLKIIAGILGGDKFLRGTDIVGRFGGEEFVIVFPGTSALNAIHPLKKISEEIQACTFDEKQKKFSNVTVSCGVSQLRSGDQTLDDIIKRADEALYYAKEHGRNKIVVYETQFSEALPTN